MDISKLIGKTPLIRIDRLSACAGAAIYAKAELMNFSGSVKDRAACAMISEAIAAGRFPEDKTLIDATSGNTGIAYAMICASLGRKARLYMPENVTPERKGIMQAYGAEIILTSPLEGIVGAYEEVQREVTEFPDKYFYPDQYSNKENWLAHYNGTGVEIWEQTGGKITHFVSGSGTGGTFTGCTKRLREYDPDIKSVLMVPDVPYHGIEGIKHESAKVKSSFFDPALADGRIEISTEEAYEMTRRLAREYGIFAGISSGANVAAAVKLSEKVPENSVIVTVICDGGGRYLSNPVYKS